ncbi:MAG: lipoate--protein ligase family protein [Candidatus Bathyarchaeota archaeon]|nr:lipoate--protein ligase family protein [Candidatus Bathyarchaeota archaeon]MDH5595407.1 lipoate--protein ligase family protein [Candidatus Bathyarchaeota archaeon]
MGVWRLLELEVKDAFTNMAVDEAVLSARISNTVPNTLRFYRWKPSAVSVGRFQDVFNEVYVENCRKHEVDIVRRITGGGAVYHDHVGEITYSVVVKESDLGLRDVASTYDMICKGLIEAAKILGISADFNAGDPKKCPNVTINRRKISGSAQSRKKGVLLQHGTFLLDTNLEKMFTFLRVPWARTCLEVIPIAEKRLTSVKEELGTSISIKEAQNALVQGFQKTFRVQPVEGRLTSYEQKLAEKLRREKFVTDCWNFEGKMS